MKKLSNIFVSVVFVMDERTVKSRKKIEELSQLLKSHYTNYELLIVDNGLKQKDLSSISELLPKISCIRIIRLSKRHDTDTAIFAGVDASIGDFICILYGNDPVELIPKFVDKAQNFDVVFGVARNLKRSRAVEEVGARLFYWYSKRYLDINIPNGSTYFICMNRTAANSLTKSGRFMRHIRHMAKIVGFNSTNIEYNLPPNTGPYTEIKSKLLWSRGVDLIFNYSSHPLRLLTYFGIAASVLNIAYAIFVVIVNLSDSNVTRGWTTLSLQSSLMFFLLFLIIAVLAEYIGKILNEAQQEPPYHIMQELSSRVTIADETRRNVKR